MSIVHQFGDHVSRGNLFRKDDRLLLAVSGGADSVALCELCMRAGFSFGIAHANFGLRGAESEEDEQFVSSLAHKYNAPCHVRRLDAAGFALAEKVSTQVAARDLRYRWFDELMREGYKYLLTGHHADDNIETLLMNFFRGTGIRGLHGIRSKKGYLVRPLLPFSRENLMDFLKEEALVWREDSSNLSDKYTRNYFRNTVMPLIRKVFPEVDSNLSENIRRFSEAELLYDQAVAWNTKNLLVRKGSEIHIPILKLMMLEPVETILHEILTPYNFSARQVPEVIQLTRASQGSFTQSATHRVIRDRNWLIIAGKSTTDAEHLMLDESMSNLEFASGSLRISLLSAGHFHLSPEPTKAQLDRDEIVFPLVLRKWRPGDYFYPLGMRKKKKISRFLIDLKLSPTEKENTWVLESANRILWVLGRRIDDRFRVTEKTREVLEIEYSLSY